MLEHLTSLNNQFESITIFTEENLNLELLQNLLPNNPQIILHRLDFAHFFDFIINHRGKHLFGLFGAHRPISKTALKYLRNLSHDLILLNYKNFKIDSRYTMKNIEFLKGLELSSSQSFIAEEKPGKVGSIKIHSPTKVQSRIQDEAYYASDLNQNEAPRDVKKSTYQRWNIAAGSIFLNTEASSNITSNINQEISATKIHLNVNEAPNINLMSLIAEKINSFLENYYNKNCDINLAISSPYAILVDALIEKMTSILPDSKLNIYSFDFLSLEGWSPALTFYNLLYFHKDPLIFVNFGSYPNIDLVAIKKAKG